MTVKAVEPLRSWVWYRSQIASAIARDPNADVTELRRHYNEALLRSRIEAGLDKMPPLTSEQRARLAAILTAPKRRRLAS